MPKTGQLLAQRLGVDETGAIYLALHQLAVKVLPQYEADDGPLSTAQVRQIKKLGQPKGKPATGSVRSSLLGTKPA